MHNITVARAVERIGQALHEETGPGSYYDSWLANIVMPIYDQRGKLNLETMDGCRAMGTILLDHFWPKPGPSLSISMLPPVQAEIVLNKQLRQDLDEILQVLKASNGSRHRSLAITHLEDVIMRLGMDCKVRNESLPPAERAPSPYPSSYDPKTAHVEPTADHLKL